MARVGDEIDCILGTLWTMGRSAAKKALCFMALSAALFIAAGKRGVINSAQFNSRMNGGAKRAYRASETIALFLLVQRST
jgi:hypothetical protein